MKKTIFIAAFIFINIPHIFCQKVKNVQWQYNLDSCKVFITYKLTGVDRFKTCKIYPEASFDNAEQELDTSYLSGDYGEIKTKGEKNIAWDIFEQIPYNLLRKKKKAMFQLSYTCCKYPIPPQLFLSYNISGSSLYGLTFGLISRWGFYVRGKTNGSIENSDLLFENGYVTNYPGTGYYLIDEKVRRSRLGITAGVIHRIFNNFYISVGAGYGFRNLMWHYNDYEYDRNTLTGESYVKDNRKSATGCEMELGVNYKIGKRKRLFINAGMNTINFKFFEPNFGIGYVFKEIKK